VVPCGVGGGVIPLGVASRTLILGNAAGAGAFVVVDADPDSSTFFPAIEARLACLEATRVAGGGLFNRGEAGHCGVVSPEAGPTLFAPAREGNFDTASDTAPPVPAESCGTLLAESARCIAAAEGCDELDWFDRALGRPSLRMGDGLREVLGLEVEDCEDEVGSIEAECCLRKVGGRVEDAELWRVALGLLRWTVAVEDADAEDMAEPSDGGAGGRSAGRFGCSSADGRGSWESVGMMLWEVGCCGACAPVSLAIGATDRSRHEPSEIVSCCGLSCGYDSGIIRKQLPWCRGLSLA
jgi:hypothetical protein